MNCWVDCPKDGVRKDLDECEKCSYFEGIAPRDSRAWMRNLPNCDMVCCGYGNQLVPIQNEELEVYCSYCAIRDSCPLFRKKLLESSNLRGGVSLENRS